MGYIHESLNKEYLSRALLVFVTVKDSVGEGQPFTIVMVSADAGFGNKEKAGKIAIIKRDEIKTGRNNLIMSRPINC